MELKFPLLRAELIEELDSLQDMCEDLKVFADERSEWQDDEDDCLLAAMSQTLKAQNAVRRVREVLEEVP